MKKNLLKGMMVLFASTAFVACSHDTDFESVAQDNVKNQYIAAFEKKYGKVDPNQSWDFTSYAGIMTRGESTPAMTWKLAYYGSQNSTDVNGMKYKEMSDAVIADFDEVKRLVYSTDRVPFDYTYCQAHLYPAFSHGYVDLNDKNYQYFYLGAEYTYNNQTVSSANVVSSNVTFNTRLYTDYWFSFEGKAPDTRSPGFGLWRDINTIPLINATSARWWVGAKEPNKSTYEKRTVEYCKLFTVNERQYIAFDCNNDGDYSDLICWIQVFDWTTKEEPKAKGKRYLVEDLGTFDDFDFNDIVFDVVELADGSQKCYVRALGGIYNIIINIGTTTWQKKDSKLKDENGVEFDAVVSQMYNTTPPNKDWVLAEFDIKDKDWDPINNNVTVTVIPGGDGEFYSIPVKFPEVGEVPMMVAVNVTKLWMVEKQSISDMPAAFLNDNNYEYEPAAQ